MKKKLTALLVAFVVILRPTASNALEPDADASIDSIPGDAVIYPMAPGDSAPYPGILFSPRAAATVAANAASAAEKTQVEVETAVKRVSAEKDFQLKELKIVCDSDKAQASAKLEADLKRIDALEAELKKAKETPSTKAIWGGVGAAVGAATTILLVFAVNQAAK